MTELAFLQLDNCNDYLRMLVDLQLIVDIVTGNIPLFGTRRTVTVPKLIIILVICMLLLLG
jgi:hypothetical protein